MLHATVFVVHLDCKCFSSPRFPPPPLGWDCSPAVPPIVPVAQPGEHCRVFRQRSQVRVLPSAPKTPMTAWWCLMVRSIRMVRGSASSPLRRSKLEAPIRDRAEAARQAHNLKVEGSIPSPVTRQLADCPQHSMACTGRRVNKTVGSLTRSAHA